MITRIYFFLFALLMVSCTTEIVKPNVYEYDHALGLVLHDIEYDALKADAKPSMAQRTDGDTARLIRKDWDFITLTQFTHERGFIGVKMDVDLHGHQRVDIYLNEQYTNMSIVGNHCRNRTIATSFFKEGDYFHIRVTHTDSGEVWEEGIWLVEADQ